MQTQIDKLTQRFLQIDRERMQGLPFYNEQLHVEAIGFQETEEGYVGVLITPWFINLILLFKQQPEIHAVVGRKCSHALPSGEYDFMIGEDEELGRYDFISLASPVGQFKTQQQAQDFSKQKLRSYFAPVGTEQADEHPLVFVSGIDREMSRRAFLAGHAQTEINKQ